MGRPLISLLFVLFPALLFSQEERSNAPIREIAGYQIESFTLPGGRLSNNVNCILQGPNDFIWFGSQDGLHRFDGHEYITYGKEDGDTTSSSNSLNFSYIENLFWDRSDKLWVCTYGGGVYRFDPKTEEFKHYNLASFSSTSTQNELANFVMCAAEDALGNLWFGTKQGLFCIDQKTEEFKHFIHDPSDPNSLSATHVSNIYLDRQGTLWVSTGFIFSGFNTGGLNRFDPTTNSFTTYLHDKNNNNSLGSNLVKGLLEDSKGGFWVTSSAGIQKMDRNTGVFEDNSFQFKQASILEKEDQVFPSAYSLLEDREGAIWIGSTAESKGQSHALRYDLESSEILSFPILAWQITESKDGTIWVCTAGVSGEVMKITSNIKEQDLDRGDNIFNDFKKTKLYQTLSGKITADRLVGPLSITFDPVNNSMWGRYVYDQGNKTGKNTYYPILVNYDQHKNESKFYYPESINLEHITSAPFAGNNGPDWLASGMAIDKEGKIWTTYSSDSVGIFSFNPKTGDTKHYAHNPDDSTSLSSNLIVRMIMDSQGFIWSAHNSEGLNRLDPATGKSIHFSPDAKPPFKIAGNFPMAILEDQQGRILVGGENIYKHPFITIINGDLSSSQDIFSSNDINNPVRFMAINKEKLVFSIDNLGLKIIDLPKSTLSLVSYTADNNFPIYYVSSIVFDHLGNLWGDSNYNNQFVCLNLEKENWLSIKANTPDASRVRTGVLGPDGHIYFPGEHNGWREIDPVQFNKIAKDSAYLNLTNFYINGERQLPGKSDLLSAPIWELDQLYLPNRVISFTLRFSSFDYHSPNVKYKYRLSPYEEEWKFLDNQPEVTYSYLPTGTYQFQVKAYSMNGLVDGKGINLEIIILPPWWNTWWAYIIYFILLVLLVLGINQYQRRRWKMRTQLQLEQERANRLKELDQFKSRFYTNITHEFRTPLTVIKGMADEMEGNPKIKRMIRQNSDHLLNMVNQLLDLSKLESQSLNINWINADMIQFLQYLTESCHSLAHKKNISLSFFSQEEQLIMDFDEYRIQQILINLISNAIKFTPEFGSVKVIASKTVKEDQAFLKLQVSDTGKGIPPEQLDNIFDRFYQVDDSSTRINEGSGIGLALVKELTELMKGHLLVDSDVSDGTDFYIFLPITNTANKKEPETTVEINVPLINTSEVFPIADSNSDEERALVLVIEDNADIRSYIHSILKKDFNLIIANNGRQGIEKALEKVPDVILCDVMMPEMNGFEVCAFLKKDIHTSHIPIILLTAKSSQEDRVMGLKSGADAYLTKPFDKQELMIRLENLSAQSKQFRDRLKERSTSEIPLNESESQEATFLTTLDNIIQENLGDELFDTNQLCRAIMMSRTQLHRKLKALTGASTANYIRTARLEKAKLLLEISDLPIGEIAFQVGFKDFSHFSRSYTKAFGVNPSETRK